MLTRVSGCAASVEGFGLACSWRFMADCRSPRDLDRSWSESYISGRAFPEGLRRSLALGFGAACHHEGMALSALGPEFLGWLILTVFQVGLQTKQRCFCDFFFTTSKPAQGLRPSIYVDERVYIGNSNVCMYVCMHFCMHVWTDGGMDGGNARMLYMCVCV